MLVYAFKGKLLLFRLKAKFVHSLARGNHICHAYKSYFPLQINNMFTLKYCPMPTKIDSRHLNTLLCKQAIQLISFFLESSKQTRQGN